MAEHGDVRITHSDKSSEPASVLRALMDRYSRAAREREDREWPGRIVLEHDDGGRVLLELPLPADVAGAIIKAAGEHDLELVHTDAGNDRQQVVAQAKRIAFLEDKLERREADAADLKCALEEERERHADVTGPEDPTADGEDDPGEDNEERDVTLDERLYALESHIDVLERKLSDHATWHGNHDAEVAQRLAAIFTPDDGESDPIDAEVDEPDEDPSAERDSYIVTIRPHPRQWHNPAGPWLIRCYTVTGEHIHSAEGGITLDVGLDEVKRAIHDREADR